MKNIRINIIYIVAILLIAATSCFKDDEHYWDYSNATSAIELPEGVNAAGYVSKAIEVLPSIDVAVRVNLASPNTTDHDITVKLSLDNTSFIDTINAKQTDIEFELLPDSVYTVSSWEVTIPAGKRTADFKLNVKANKVDLSKSYLIPLKIAQVPDGYFIPTNFGTKVYRILVKTSGMVFIIQLVSSFIQLRALAHFLSQGLMPRAFPLPENQRLSPMPEMFLIYWTLRYLMKQRLSMVKP